MVSAAAAVTPVMRGWVTAVVIVAIGRAERTRLLLVVLLSSRVLRRLRRDGSGSGAWARLCAAAVAAAAAVDVVVVRHHLVLLALLVLVLVMRRDLSGWFLCLGLWDRGLSARLLLVERRSRVGVCISSRGRRERLGCRRGHVVLLLRLLV